MVDSFLMGIALLAGMFGSAGTKMAIKRMHIPWAEIYLKKGPIIWIYFNDRTKQPFSPKIRNGYFVLYKNRIKGIFKINPKYVYFMGKTPCYDYSERDMNPIDSVIVDELNRFADKNNLTKIKRRDVKHSNRLRDLILRHGSKAKALEVFDSELEKSYEHANKVIKETAQEINTEIAEKEKEKDQEIKLTPSQYSIKLIDHLRNKALITEEEANTFVYKIENNLLEFSTLIEELRESNIISINEPMDVSVERFLEDFGSQEPLQLSGHVDDLRMDRKGLKTMTATPVKSFLPGGVILAIGLCIIIAIVVIPGQWENITSGFAKGGAGNPLAGLMGGHLSLFAKYLPAFFSRF